MRTSRVSVLSENVTVRTPPRNGHLPGVLRGSRLYALTGGLGHEDRVLRLYRRDLRRHGTRRARRRGCRLRAGTGAPREAPARAVRSRSHGGGPAGDPRPGGAGIRAGTVEGDGELPPLVVESVGYGAGTHRLDFPDVLRVLVGHEGALEPAGPLRPLKGTTSSPDTTREGHWHAPARVS